MDVMKKPRVDLSRESRFLLLRSGLLITLTAGCGGSIAGPFSKGVRRGAPPVRYSQR